MVATGWLLRSRHAAIILTAVVGTLMTIGAFLLVCSWEYRVAVIDFQSKAKSYLEIINADLGDAKTLLYDIAGFVGSINHPVTANEFARFSAASHERVSGLRDTAWAPRVTLARRPRFERDARAAGLAGYQIVEFGPHRKLIRAAPRPEYYALLYVEAAVAKRRLLGLDLIAEKQRAAAARRALETGQPAATPPIDVVTVTRLGGGVLSYMPVYSGPSGARRRPAQGLVLGVFDIPAFVGSIVTKRANADGLNLYLFNPNQQSNRRVIYRTPAFAASGAPLSERALVASAHWQSSVLLIDQHLGAIVTPAQPLQLVRWSLFGTTTLIVGFVMTGMSVAYLLMLLRGMLQLEAVTASLRATTKEVTRISLHDPLTGMPNRLLFDKRIDEALELFCPAAPFALLFLDLDRFKAVNDTFGHGTGDRLLCAVAERINRCIREVDLSARLGGDEFAILLADADQAVISTIADRLIESLSGGYTFDDEPVFVGVSIGAAIATQNSTAQALVAQADVAMYEAKAAGRGAFRVFDERPGTSPRRQRHGPRSTPG